MEEEETVEVVADREQPLVQLGAPIHPYGISVSTKKKLILIIWI